MGVWSMYADAAASAPTRFAITCVTSTERSPAPPRTTTLSPTRTVVAGFALSPLTRTCPALQAAVACVRVLYKRTAHVHASTRAEEGAMSRE